MKAISVFPGKPNSVHVAELPKPSVDQVPNGRGVLVKVLRVGVDGTDKEINAAEYGAAPPGYDFLVIGAGTIGLLATLVLRLRGLDVTTFARSTKPYLNANLIEELGARYISTKETSILDAAKQHGPFDLIFEGTGNSSVVFDSMQALGKNGVLVLSSVTGGDKMISIPADRINLEFVLGNKVMVGTVNANREYFELGVRDMAQGEAEYPGWLSKLLTDPVQGLENYPELFKKLTSPNGAIKVFCQVAEL